MLRTKGGDIRTAHGTREDCAWGVRHGFRSNDVVVFGGRGGRAGMAKG